MINNNFDDLPSVEYPPVKTLIAISIYWHSEIVNCLTWLVGVSFIVLAALVLLVLLVVKMVVKDTDAAFDITHPGWFDTDHPTIREMEKQYARQSWRVKEQPHSQTDEQWNS